MKTTTTYISPVFRNADGTPMVFRIPAEAYSTYEKRDGALQQIMYLGGIHAEPTEHFMKIRRRMLAAKRKIERMGWHSVKVTGVPDPFVRSFV